MDSDDMDMEIENQQENNIQQGFGHPMSIELNGQPAYNNGNLTTQQQQQPENQSAATVGVKDGQQRPLQQILADLNARLAKVPKAEVDKQEIGQIEGFTIATVPAAESGVPLLEQTGQLIVGPGAEKEAQLLGLGLPKLGFRQHDDLAKGKKYAMEQSIKQVLMKQTISHQANQQKVAMYAQALSLMARVYIGSVSFELREESIRSTFGPFGPIKSVSMSWDPVTGHHKGFAFLEYDVPEAALLAQEQMNGVLMGGRNIKVGRPSNMPQAQPIIEMIMEEAKQYHRIYIASIHPDLTEADVRSVFEAFGNVINIQLAKNSAHGSTHRGYGYLEYDNPKSAADAVASMNLFDLGGQYLRVGKAITPPQAQAFTVPTQVMNMPTAAAVAAASVTAQIQAMEAKAGHNPIASAGMADAPTVLVGATPQDIQTGVTGGAVFSVPAPGVATPQSIATSLPPAAAANPAVVAAMSNSTTTGTIFNRTMSEADFISNKPASPALRTGSLSPGTLSGSRGVSPAAPPVVPPPQVVEVRGLGPPPLSTAPSLSTPNDTNPMAVVPFDNTPPRAEGTVAKVGAKKKKPKKKKGKGTGASEGDTEQTSDVMQQLVQPKAVDVQVQQIVANTTATRLLESGHLTEKQKKMIESEAGSSLAAQEDLKIKGNEARNILMHKLMRNTESCILCLKNMVGPGDVDEYLEEEVQEECSKYGQVDQVVIYQEKHGERAEAPVVVKIFVKFSLPQEAETAKNSLHNRYFNGNIIKAGVYDQNLFEHNDLTG